MTMEMSKSFVQLSNFGKFEEESETSAALIILYFTLEFFSMESGENIFLPIHIFIHVS